MATENLHKLSTYLTLRWTPFTFSRHALKSCERPTVSRFRGDTCRFYNKKAAKREIEHGLNVCTTSNRENVGGRVSRVDRRHAQAALLEYLYSTRSLYFLEAEHISLHSPRFLRSLIKKASKIEPESHCGLLLARFLRYHPINEFEPFFESIGLDPSEFIPHLPQGSMFLIDHACLLENFRALRNYGFPNDKIGRIYKKAKEVFGANRGYLSEKLKNLEGLGLNQLTVINAVASCPRVLISNGYDDFGRVLVKLKSIGLEHDWIDKHDCLLDKESYNWRRVHELLRLISEFGCNRGQLQRLLSLHPEAIFCGSGNCAFSLIGFLIKFGSTNGEICSVLSQFPEISIGKLVRNLKHCYLFLKEIEMKSGDIGRIVRLEPTLLGLCSLKRPKTLLANLRVSKKRVSKIVEENPHVLRNWVLGSKVERLPRLPISEIETLEWKANFLVKIGFTDNSECLRKVLKIFRGNGLELQERFNCLVETGFDKMDVLRMSQSAPQIMNQSKEAILSKVGTLVDDLAYSIPEIVRSPSCLAYTSDRVRLRRAMYKWLHDQGVTGPNLALNSYVATSDKLFVAEYVNRHPKGPQVWQELKEKIYNV